MAFTGVRHRPRAVRTRSGWPPVNGGGRGCMSSPVSSRRRNLLGEEAVEGLVACWVVGGAVVPAVPDHVQPRAGEDPDRVRVVFAAAGRAGVDPGGPRAG